MNFFATLKDHILSLPTLFGVSSDSSIVLGSNSVLQIMR